VFADVTGTGKTLLARVMAAEAGVPVSVLFTATICSYTVCNHSIHTFRCRFNATVNEIHVPLLSHAKLLRLGLLLLSSSLPCWTLMCISSLLFVAAHTTI
jgi:hypothetical protein